jgi:hypothetical protein
MGRTKTQRSFAHSGRTKTQRSFAHSGKFSAFALPQATAIASPAVTKIKPFGLKVRIIYIRKNIYLCIIKIRIINRRKEQKGKIK